MELDFFCTYLYQIKELDQGHLDAARALHGCYMDRVNAFILVHLEGESRVTSKLSRKMAVWVRV